MDIIAKIFALGVIGAIGTIILNKASKQDLAVILDLALLVLALGLVFDKIKSLFNTVVSMFGGM